MTTDEYKAHETEMAALRQEFERDILPKVRDRSNKFYNALPRDVMDDVAWTTFKLSRAIIGPESRSHD